MILDTFLKQAAEDRPVYLTDVREAFQAQGTRPFHLHAVLYDGSVRVFPLKLPQGEGEFLAEYVHAHIYNILSTLGAVRMDIYLDQEDRALAALAGGLGEVFQVDRAKGERTGYGKCLNVNERVLAALFQGRERFAFRMLDITEEPAGTETLRAAAGQPVFAQLPGRTRGRMLLGMDVGGTDVKLAVSVDGQLVLCKELTGFPPPLPGRRS